MKTEAVSARAICAVVYLFLARCNKDSRHYPRLNSVEGKDQSPASTDDLSSTGTLTGRDAAS